MSVSLKDLAYEEQGVRLVSPCLELVVYVGEPLERCARGMLGFYQAFLRLFGDRVRWYNTNTMGRMKKVTSQVLDMLPFWMQDARSPREPLLGLDMHSGPEPKSAVPPAFSLMADQAWEAHIRHTLRLVFPHDWLQGESGPFLDLVHAALADLPILCGYAGYSLLWRDLNPGLLEELPAKVLRPWLRRFPGLMHGVPTELCHAATEGVPCVSWLTLLGHSYVGKLGGGRRCPRSCSRPCSCCPWCWSPSSPRAAAERSL
jgi:hypothetical protein